MTTNRITYEKITNASIALPVFKSLIKRGMLYMRVDMPAKFPVKHTPMIKVGPNMWLSEKEMKRRGMKPL